MSFAIPTARTPLGYREPFAGLSHVRRASSPDRTVEAPSAGPVASGARWEEPWMFRVMFYSPRIAPNTGNAIRMVAATGCELHLVEPLGFDLSEPKLRRAGLDYHDLASVTVHADLQAAWAAVMPARVFAFTAHADVVVRRHRLPARRRADVRAGADGPGRGRRWPTRTSPRRCASRCSRAGGR